MVEDPGERFTRILLENNLTAKFQDPVIRPLKDGALLFERPKLLITYTDPKKEEYEQTAEKMGGKAPKR